MGSANWFESVEARLIRQSGRWTLEVSEMVQVDGDVFDARRRRVVGEDAIVKHLRTNVRDATLTQATLHLLRTCRDDGRAFQMIDGEWCATSHLSSRDRAVLEELSLLMTRLREEVATLTGKERKLEKLVAKLEGQLERGIRAAAAAASKQASAPEEPPEDQGVGGLDALAEDIPAAAAPAKPPAKDKRCEIPAKLELFTCLKQLVGTDFRWQYTRKPAAELMQHPAGFYGCTLVDDTEEHRGVLLANARACAVLGGTLLGLPESAIEHQAISGDIDSDSMEAMSEVGNNLSGIVNRVSPNCHVRTRPLAPVVWEDLAWLEASSRACVLTSESGGTLWIVAR
jgi:hypothetical protein